MTDSKYTIDQILDILRRDKSEHPELKKLLRYVSWLETYAVGQLNTNVTEVRKRFEYFQGQSNNVAEAFGRLLAWWFAR